MAAKRNVEIFSAGCPACQDVIDLVNRIARPNCDIEVLDLKNREVATWAKALGVRALPAVAVDGRLASCCSGPGPNEDSLKATGIGQ